MRPLVGDTLDPLAVKSLSYVTPEVNKKIRMQLLKQHWFTNRFYGSNEAHQVSDSRARSLSDGSRRLALSLFLSLHSSACPRAVLSACLQAELEFSLMVSRYQLQRVRWRLATAGVVITLSAIEPFVNRESADLIVNLPVYVVVSASDGFRWLLVASDGFRWLPMASERLPMASDDFRRLLMASDGFRLLLMASDGFRWLLIACAGVAIAIGRAVVTC